MIRLLPWKQINLGQHCLVRLSVLIFNIFTIYFSVELRVRHGLDCIDAEGEGERGALLGLNIYLPDLQPTEARLKIYFSSAIVYFIFPVFWFCSLFWDIALTCKTQPFMILLCLYLVTC